MSDTIRMDQIAPASGPISSVPHTLHPGPSTPQQTPKMQKASEQTTANPNSHRKDMESLYFSLKAALSDKWSDYKTALSLFVLGRINQQELQQRIGPYLTSDPATLYYHNHLICAICYNVTRDPPEPGVAAWVSATEKPSAGPKLSAGDEFEQRLKTEVMQLPARDRHRLKTIHDDPYRPLVELFAAQRATREMHVPEVGAVSSSKTNWEPEIRKRYTQPLAVEMNDLPDIESLHARMTPICYEEGLPGGCSGSGAEFLNIALKTFLTGALSHLFQRTRSNGARFVKTARFAKRLEKEEEMCARDEVRRNVDGFLPVEVEAIARRKAISLSDLKMSIRLGDPFFGQIPLLCRRLLETGAVTDDDDPDVLVVNSNGVSVVNLPTSLPSAGISIKAGGRPVTNGVHPFLKKQQHHHPPLHLRHHIERSPGMSILDVAAQTSPSFAIGRSSFMDSDVDMMDVDGTESSDEDDGGEHDWQGADMEDIMMLNSLLDDCIAV